MAPLSTRKPPPTVVLTGASSGIGRGVAERLAKTGANVVLAARSTALLDKLAATNPNALAVTTDVGSADDVVRLRDAAIERFGGIDVWINNAAAGAVGDVTEIPLEDHRRVVETTLIGVINGSHAALQHFESVGRGILINVASSGGKTPFPFFSSYVASKFGVVGFGEALRLELRQRGLKGIHVCTVNPWVTDTPWFTSAANYTGRTLRMPRPDDPAKVVDAIVRLIDHPKASVDIGPARGTSIFTRLFPASTERMTAKVTESYLESSPVAAPRGSNGLFEPLPGTRGVDGGMRKRVKAENRLKG